MYWILQAPLDATIRLMLSLLQRNLLPDTLIRSLIRRFLASRLRYSYRPSCQLQHSQLLQFIHSLKEIPMALINTTDQPNTNMYELPALFFKMVFGDNIKFSCCYFINKSSTLEDAEEAMLKLYCERARINDGQTILDIGCGYGSLCLYIARNYKNCRVTGITDSTSQKAYIDVQCRDLQLQNVEIIAADIRTFENEATYDRVLSVEMFEHIKNYKDLLKKISGWMKQDSLLFVHHMCHKTFAYNMERLIEVDWINEYDWLTTNFFDGGVMLSADLLLYFQDDVSVVDHWLVSGMHYLRTGEEWLKRMDRNLPSIKPIMESTYGKDSATKWTVYWRTLFLYIEELFGYNDGEEWMVAHYLFKKR